MKQAKTLLKEETEANICKWRISSGSSLTNKKPGKKSAFGDYLAYILSYLLIFTYYNGSHSKLTQLAKLP